MSSSATQVFPRLQDDQVPAGSRPLLEKVKKGFGFIPNLFAVFSNSPILLEGYIGLEATYSKGTLSPAERQLVLLTASVVNECAYCTAAHSTLAKGMLKVPAAVVAAVQAYAKINAAGEWIDRTETVSMNDLFERMSTDELEAYAQAGTLPGWFRATARGFGRSKRGR